MRLWRRFKDCFYHSVKNMTKKIQLNLPWKKNPGTITVKTQSHTVSITHNTTLHTRAEMRFIHLIPTRLVLFMILNFDFVGCGYRGATSVPLYWRRLASGTLRMIPAHSRLAEMARPDYCRNVTNIPSRTDYRLQTSLAKSRDKSPLILLLCRIYVCRLIVNVIL